MKECRHAEKRLKHYIHRDSLSKVFSSIQILWQSFWHHFISSIQWIWTYKQYEFSESDWWLVWSLFVCSCTIVSLRFLFHQRAINDGSRNIFFILGDSDNTAYTMNVRRQVRIHQYWRYSFLTLPSQFANHMCWVYQPSEVDFSESTAVPQIQYPYLLLPMLSVVSKFLTNATYTQRKSVS